MEETGLTLGRCKCVLMGLPGPKPCGQANLKEVLRGGFHTRWVMKRPLVMGVSGGSFQWVTESLVHLDAQEVKNTEETVPETCRKCAGLVLV